MKKVYLSIILLLLISSTIQSQLLPTKAEVIQVMKSVNDYWIAQNPVPGNNQWARAAYFTGNMDFYKIYSKEKYLNYALLWANNNNWSLNGGTSTRNADNQTCGQVYIDLYKLDPNSSENKILAIKTSIDKMVSSNTINDWWWVDALYMSMPVFARLGDLYRDDNYFQKLYQLYNDTKLNRALYNTDDKIWYRDGNFMQENDTTVLGKKIYWSRGNGWAIAAHVRTLQLLPENHTNRAEYVQIIQEMASALKTKQQSNGFWHVNLADSTHFAGPETSGTSFFVYSLAWGINNNILDRNTYLPTVLKGWKALTTIAVQPNGFLAYVQGVGSEPKSSQPVTINSTADFGVGAFLLAGTEIVKLATGEMPIPSNMNLISAKPISKNQIEVKFSQKLNSENSLNINNYSIDNNVIITNITVGTNDSTVLLQTSTLIPAQYKLSVQNVSSTTGQLVENTENIIFAYTGIAAVTASGFEPNTANTAEKTLDFDFGTRWSCEGSGAWILYDLGEIKLINNIQLAYYNGASRKAYLKIQLSTALTDTIDVFNGETSGTTSELETYTFNPVNARYVKIFGYGNSSSKWNSITETRINYQESGTGLNLTSSNNVFTIYPNPSNGKHINITISENELISSDISISDLFGRQIKGFRINFNKNQIILSDLALQSGLYLFKYNTKSARFIVL
jgi:rhamnogalacturonyl hydrolase YesR